MRCARSPLLQEAALAYDAAARRIRGTGAVCNFNEAETEELVALYGIPALPDESGARSACSAAWQARCEALLCCAMTPATL